MNKRLRKKKRAGEFKELGVVVTIAHGKKSDVEIELGCGALIDFLEAKEMVCGGGFNTEDVSLFISSAKPRGSLTEGDRRQLAEFLQTFPGMKTFRVSALVDAWHIGEASERQALEKAFTEANG